jgi:hypothetical protein
MDKLGVVIVLVAVAIGLAVPGGPGLGRLVALARHTCRRRNR